MIIEAGLCKTQHMTLALGFSLWGIENPSTKYSPRPANDLRWGTRGRAPTSALSALKPLLFAPLPAGTGLLQCASGGDGRSRFSD
jgi:hypothetical protein